jgi:hypothetical protein
VRNRSQRLGNARVRLWVAFWVLCIPAVVVGFDLAQQRGISRFHDNQTVQGPLRLESARQWSQGRIPLWNPYKRAGAPLLADVSGALYPPNALFGFSTAETRGRTLDWLGGLHHLLASACMYFFLSSIGLRREASVSGALLYSLSGFFVFGSARWIDLQNAMAWAPLVLACLVRGARTQRMWLWSAAGAASYAAQIYCGYPEYSFYTGLLTAGLGVALVTRNPDRWRQTVATTALIGIGGALLAAPQLLTTLEAAAVGTRPAVVPFAEFVSLSLTPHDLLGVLVPVAAADLWPSVSIYLSSGALYLGVAALALAAAGLCRMDAFSRYALAVTAVGAVLALGPNSPFGALGYYLPGMNAFRSPMKHLFEFSLGLALLSSIGIDRFLGAAPRSREFVGVGGLVCAAFAGYSALEVGSGLGLGFGWVSAATGLVVAVVAFIPDRRFVVYFLIFISVSGLVWNRSVALSQLRQLPTFREIDATAASALPGELTGRVLLVRDPASRNGLVGDLAVAWQIPSVHGAGPFLWQPLANATGMDEVGTLTNLAVLEPDDPTLDRLAVHTLLSPKRPSRRAIHGKLLRGQPNTGVSEMAGFLRVDRSTALAFARIADRVICAPEPPGTATEHRSTGVVSCTGPSQDPDSSPGSVARIRIDAGEIELEASVRGPEPGLLLISQSDYPGWTAEIDGIPVPIVRTFGFLQGVWVPPGNHEVRLAYQPKSFLAGVGLAVIAAAGLLVGRRLERKREAVGRQGQHEPTL